MVFQTGYMKALIVELEVKIKKKMWKEKNTSNTWKENNLREARSRLSGWQLQTFLSSYESKKKN